MVGSTFHTDISLSHNHCDLVGHDGDNDSNDDDDNADRTLSAFRTTGCMRRSVKSRQTRFVEIQCDQIVTLGITDNGTSLTPTYV